MTKNLVPKLSDLGQADVMGQLLAKQSGKFQTLTVGQEIEGTVIEVGNNALVIDVGAKSEGLVRDLEFASTASFIRTLKPDDKVKATVVVPETASGQPLLSVRTAAQSSGWKTLEEAFKNKSEIEVKVENTSRGGLGVSFDSISGFIPTSQLGSVVSQNPQAVVGKTLKAKVTEINKDDDRAIFSERAVSEAELLARQEEVLKSIKEGDRFRGRVTSVVNFGAFVQIVKDDVTLEGLVHLSELSWTKVSDPARVLKEGQEVEVVALGRDVGRFALSIKRTQEDPWEAQTKELTTDQQVKGKVAKMGDIGAFIEIAPGVEGLLRFNKIPDGVSLKEGQEVSVFIEEVDRKNKKLSLRMVLTAKPVGYK